MPKKVKTRVTLLARQLSAEKLLLMFGIIFGIFIVWSIPPIFGNDELVHFPRAYQVQEGKLGLQHLNGPNYGGYLPVQIVKMNDGFREQVQNKHPDMQRVDTLKAQYADEKLSGNERQSLAFTSAGVYSSWAYFPAALGIKIARIFSLPLIWYIYLARLSCFLIWLALVYLAIRIIPVGKYFLVFVALLPTSLVQAATIGMDGIVNGLAWLIVAITLAVLAKKIKFSPKVIAITLLLSLYLATTKQGYALIAAMPLIIPSRFYNLSKKQARTLRVIFGALLVIVAAWYVKATAPLASILHQVQRPGLYVDSGAQVRYFLSHPISVTLAILFAPFTISYLGVYAGVVGVLTNRLIYLPIPLIILLYLALIAVIMNMKGTSELRSERRRLLLGSSAAFVGTFILINLALYVSFTKVGNPSIEGVQGRYLLPLAPLLVAMRAGWQRPIYKLPLVVLVSVALILIIGLTTAITIIR